MISILLRPQIEMNDLIRADEGLRNLCLNLDKEIIEQADKIIDLNEIRKMKGQQAMAGAALAMEDEN
jgi:hypothetical protein